MMNAIINHKKKLLVLGLCIFLLGCTNADAVPLVNTTDTKLPEPTAVVVKATTLTITPTSSLEKSECASNKVENRIPDPNLPGNYVGKMFDTLKLPNGLEFVFGSLISNSNFALVQVKDLENNTYLLWLTENKCHNDYIHDVLVLPILRDNEELVIRYCRLNGQEDPELLAVGEFTSGTIPLTKIEYVWRANQETKKFEVVPSEGIECWRDIGIGSP